MMTENAPDIARLLRAELDERDAGRLLKAAQSLYPGMAPSPTSFGYWHIRTRTGFSVPYFGADEADLATEASSDFCALYFARHGRGRRGTGEGDGVLRTVFCGSFPEDAYDAVDRAFRILTDEVLESAWPKLNSRRGRILGRSVGYVTGVLLPLLAAGWLWRSSPAFGSMLTEILLLVPRVYQTLACLLVGLIFMGACSSLLGSVGAAIGGFAGRLCERHRLRRLGPLAAGFAYGPAASDSVRREFSVVSEEQKKRREFERFEEAGIDISHADFLKVYDVLAYLQQLGLTERQRRDEVEALAVRLGPDFPVSIMRLAEPFVPRDRAQMA